MLEKFKSLFSHLKQQIVYNNMFKPGAKFVTENPKTGNVIISRFNKESQFTSIKQIGTNIETTRVLTDYRKHSTPITYARKRIAPNFPTLVKENSSLKIY